ncbi:MAG TPA: hypothetical protein VET87_12110 [Rubrivivax sp.]|nr:hypothetical protein [Rubrivivax sp.]
MLELLGVVPFLKAVVPGETAVSLGSTELIPAVAIIPFVLYQLAGFGTLHYVVSKPVNWLINLAILALIVIGYGANREGDFNVQLTVGAILVTLLAVTVVYGVLKLRAMQALYDKHCPPRPGKHHGDEVEAAASPAR